MENTVDRNQVFETVSASGIVYLTLDSQLVYWHRFEQHIKINVVFDKGVPAFPTDSANTYSFSSNGQISYDSTHQNEAAVSANYNNTKPHCDINYMNNEVPASFDNQVPSDIAACRFIEMAGSGQDVLPKEFTCSKTMCSNSDITSAASVDVSEAEEVENVLETVKSKKVDDNSEHESFTKDDFNGSTRTSQRLSHISLKISRSYVAKDFLKEKSKDKKHKAKMKKDDIRVKKKKDKIKYTSKESPLKISLSQLKKTSEIKIINRELEKSRKLKTKIRDYSECPRIPKVRKLELVKEVKCEYCLQMFRTQQEYFDHRKGDRMSFKCKTCGKAVPFKAHLMVHMRKHSNLQEFLPLEETDSKHQNSESKASSELGGCKSSKQIKCDVCGLNVSNIPVLKTHMMIHTGEYAYSCCVCGEKTHSIAKHNNHLATHLKSGKVQCKICNISFESRSDLSRHQLTHEFKCNICDQVFPNKTSRVFHYKMVHKDDILKCETCGKMFSSEEELAPHLKYHRNRAKTQCTICGLFVTRLDNHILSHSQKSEDSRVYVCDQCPKQFRQKLSFQRHLRTHSEEKPYACMECPKRFARSGGLRRHMITHTQEKPFVCNICGKACSQMGNLRIHMQIHKDSSPVQCKVCGDTFSYKNSLQEHMRTTHYVDMGSDDPSRYLSSVPDNYYV